MTAPFFQVLLRGEGGVIQVRQRARRAAALAGLSLHDQTRLATAVSEIARVALRHADSCALRFSVLTRQGQPLLAATLSGKAPGLAAVQAILTGGDETDSGAASARRLVDHFQVESRPDWGTTITLARSMPAGADAARIKEWGETLARETSPSPVEEVERQNRDMLRTLEELRRKEAELARQLQEAARLNAELERANDELDRTNKGVLSLYKEIEDKNTELLREIKERRGAEEKLARSNSELEHFAYIASHDLQEPLRMIGSFLQLLSLEYDDRLDEDGREYVRFAVDGARRMQELIEDLLTYSRVDSQGKPFAPTDMEDVLDNVLLNLRQTVEESGARVTHDPLPMVMADSLQMMQLLQNLIKNGVKFRGQEPPRVHVSVQERGDERIFSVLDNGIGIEPRYFQRIFTIFQRLHTRDEYAGTGIGLAVCKRIVERHCGRIWVESEPGRGSTFFFALPRAPCQESEAESEAPGETP